MSRVVEASLEDVQSMHRAAVRERIWGAVQRLESDAGGIHAKRRDE